MLSPESTETLRVIGEGIVVIVTAILGRRELKRRRPAPLTIAEEADAAEQGDERRAVRRSELNVLIRKVADLVGKVDELVDLVADHQNRLDEADAQKGEVSAALRALTEAIGAIRADIAKLSAL